MTVTKMDRKNKGFTLAELVAVIVLISILAGAVSIRIVKTIQKGRDARRIADIDSLVTALQAYYLDYGQYPDTSNAWTYSTEANFLSALTGGNYITQSIQDPKNNSTYRYAYRRFSAADPPYAVVGCTKFEALSSMGGTVDSVTLYYYKKLYER
jgi:general secretion pathway protein G